MKTLIAISLLFFAFTCANDNESENKSNDATPVTFTLIGKSSIGISRIPLQNKLISNQTQWNELLTTINERNNVSNNFTETNINFTEFDVIAVFRYPVENSGSTIEIIKVEQNQNNRLVTVRLEVGLLNDVRQTFHIVKVPKSAKPLIFK